MGALIVLMILSMVALVPFVWMRKPWAVAIWRRAKLIAFLYALLILFMYVLLYLAGPLWREDHHGE